MVHDSLREQKKHSKAAPEAKEDRITEPASNDKSELATKDVKAARDGPSASPSALTHYALPGSNLIQRAGSVFKSTPETTANERKDIQAARLSATAVKDLSHTEEATKENGSSQAPMLGDTCAQSGMPMSKSKDKAVQKETATTRKVIIEGIEPARKLKAAPQVEPTKEIVQHQAETTAAKAPLVVKNAAQNEATPIVKDIVQIKPTPVAKNTVQSNTTPVKASAATQSQANESKLVSAKKSATAKTTATTTESKPKAPYCERCSRHTSHIKCTEPKIIRCVECNEKVGPGVSMIR